MSGESIATIAHVISCLATGVVALWLIDRVETHEYIGLMSLILLGQLAAVAYGFFPR